ncbi:MAG: hypothetical protein AB7G13_31940 [Lautropia sp.]
MLGIMPRIEPHLLPDMAAQVARNVRLWTGGIEPLRRESFVAYDLKVGAKKTIYRDGQHLDIDTKYWYTFTADVDITRGPILDDNLGRLYYTGDGPPKYTNSAIGWADPGTMPLAFRLLGLPAPSAPSVAVGGAPTEGAEPVTVLVAYAFVTSDGFVGPPSPVSTPIQYRDGMDLQIEGLDTAPSGAYDIEKKYIYIAQTDASGSTALRFWREVPAWDTAENGTVDFTTLGESVDSPSLIAPPSDLFGLMLHPNGFMVGFTQRKFLRSEVFKPHGWPDVYQDPLGDDIVGGAIIGQQTIICTRGKTYSAIGSDPLNQSIVDLSGMQPCVSKRSIRAMPFGVLYAGPDGLVLAGGLNPLSVVSETHFTRDQWQAYKPESMHAAVHDRRYYLFWDTGSRKGCLIFEFNAAGGLHLVVESDQWFAAAHVDPRRDHLYVWEANEIRRWDDGDPLKAVWRSKEIRLSRAENIGAVRIHAERYPVTFRLLDHGAIASEVSVASSRPERMDGRDRYERVCWEVETTGKVTQVEIGSAISDLLRDG